MRLIQLAIVFAVALTVTMVTIPLVRRIAVRRRLFDVPDGVRRVHPHPIPRLGGVGVFAGFLAVVSLVWIATWTLTGNEPATPRYWSSLLIGGLILLFIGLADDLKGVRPSVKLLGQAAAAFMVCINGYAISSVSFLPGYPIELGWLSFPVTFLWFIGVSNAFNLVDGLDGLAGGVGLIATISIGASAAILDRPYTLLYSVALAGALVGFLRYNLPPAKMFLGDSGSLVIGFFIAFMSLRGATARDGSVLALVAIFALAYPLLDTVIAMMRRWLRGHPLSRGDGRHIHHQLRSIGLSPRRALIVILLHSFAVATLGFVVTFIPPVVTAAIAATGFALLLVLFVYGARWLGYHEFGDAGSIMAAAMPIARRAIRDTINARDVVRAMESASTLAELNALLKEEVGRFGFVDMQVMLSRDSHGTETGLQYAAGAWKVVYPVARPTTMGGTGREGASMTLVIWCPTDVKIRASSAERVARLIAPAVAAWSTGDTTEKQAVSPDRHVHVPPATVKDGEPRSA